MLQVRLLGQFDIRLDGKRVTIPSRAGQSLLAYLMLTVGTAHRREKLAGILWPDTTDENARKNLRQELWRIRKAISTGQPAEKEYLLADEITLTFNRDSEYWLDVSQIERRDLDLQSLIVNLSLYQGELLPGFYDEWVAIDRERIQAIFEKGMEQLLEQLIAAERWIAVQEWGERWLTLSGAREPAYRALMLASGVRGDTAKVASLYQRCTAELLEQLGVEPSAETRGLYDGLLKGAKIPQRTSAAQPSGTITFLFTDIEGSTCLLEKLGDQYAVALSEHHEILRAAIQKWNGREVDTQGDAFFVTFTRALDAVQCAAEAQRALAAHTWVQGEQLRVRMGLHTGEPLIASTGYVGMDVHRAARIGDAGHGGQILLSPTTRELILQDLPEGMKIQDLGEHRLKDMKYPASIYQLVVAGLPTEFEPIRTKFTGTESPIAGTAPFKGLQFFDVDDSDLFFGRETLTAKLMDRLHDVNFLSVIIGASGSGKSSLVRAGLVPTLKKGNANWQVHILTPTAHPLEALAIELTRESESVTAATTLMDDLSKDPRSLHFFLSRQIQTQDVSVPRHTLLVIDQFEELFTLCRDEFEREAFIDNLLAALSPTPLPLGEERNGEGNLTLIITLRADFYAHLAQYPELRDAVAQQQEYIGPMTTEDLRRAIEEPARLGHWEFEPGLVDLILRDIGDEPGALPLLSHALLETWKRRAGHRLMLKGYADAGGVHGAIAHTAESVYQNLALNEQTIVRNILLRLTEFGEGTEDTRRRASLDELWSHAEDADQVRAVLNKLAEARLVTLSEDSAEVAHEALIREWPKLREWLSQDREGIILHRNLTEATHEWELLERDAGSVYRGARLAQANEWFVLNPSALNAQERLFLEASNMHTRDEQQQREAQRERELASAKELAETQLKSASRLRMRNRVITTVGAIAVILAILAGLFGVQSNQNAVKAQAQQALAETNFANAESQRLAAEANGVLQRSESAELAALLSLRGLQAQYSPQADAALQRASRFYFGEGLFTLPKSIDVVSFSHDGNFILTGTRDYIAHLWNVQTKKEIRQFVGHTDNVIQAVFSPDDQYVLTASNDGTARLWETATGKEIRQFPTSADSTFLPILSPDGKILLTRDDKGIIQLLDSQTGGHLLALNVINVPVATFSPDGKNVITISVDNLIQFWDDVTGQMVREFPTGGSSPIKDMDISPDGRYLVTAWEDKTLQLWDAATGTLLRTLTGHTEFPFKVVFSPNSKYLLSGSLDTTARLWEVETGKELRRYIAHTASVYSVAFSPDGHHVLTGGKDGTARLWDINAPSELNTFNSGSSFLFGLNFSNDGKYLITGSADGIATIWNPLTGEKLHVYNSPPRVDGVAISPDDKFVLMDGQSADAAGLWDIQTGNLLRTFKRANDVGIAAFTPDRKYILIGGADTKTIQLVDAQTGQTAQTFVGHQSNGPTAKLSVDGKFMVSGVDGPEEENLRWWDVATGKQLLAIKSPAGIVSVAISPDNKYILSGHRDNIVRLWDTKTSELVREFVGHTNIIWNLSFSTDGKYVLTASQDKSARLWDVTTGQQLRIFPGHGNSSVANAVFSPDGRYVVVGSFDGTAQMTYVDLSMLVQDVCSRLLRDFTDSEKTVYNITATTSTCATP
jgi:WD40 repeat protein/DNA-binding SARP family transcriptional activator